MNIVTIAELEQIITGLDAQGVTDGTEDEWLDWLLNVGLGILKDYYHLRLLVAEVNTAFNSRRSYDIDNDCIELSLGKLQKGAREGKVK